MTETDPIMAQADRDQFWAHSADAIVSAYGPAPLAPLSEVEWRIQGKHWQGNGSPMALFVAYLDARFMADMLDDWVGPLNWRDDYTPGPSSKSLWCAISIRHPLRPDEWITKRDIGTVSDIEGEKGVVSDAFKRAGCVKWGCGRNVYSLPKVKAPVRLSNQGKPVASDESLRAIQAELKRQGIDASGSRVQEGPAVDEPEQSSLPAAAPATAKKAPAARKKAAAPTNGSAPASAPAAGGDELERIRDGLSEERRVELDKFISDRGGDPANLAGLPDGKRRMVLAYARALAKRDGSEAAPAATADATPPSPPIPPSLPGLPPEDPEVAERVRFRKALVVRALKLPEKQQATMEGVFRKELPEVRGGLEELILQAPAESSWDEALHGWVVELEAEVAGPLPDGEPADQEPADDKF